MEKKRAVPIRVDVVTDATARMQAIVDSCPENHLNLNLITLAVN